MGSRRGANALRKADALIWNTDEGGVAGSVLKVEMNILDQQSKGISIDE